MLELFDETRITKARRWRGEVLVGGHFERVEHFTLRQCGQRALAVFVFFAVVEAHVIDRQIAQLFEHRTRRTKRVGRWGRQLLTSRNINGHAVEDGRRHLAGDEALPNQVVEPRLLARQHALHLSRCAQSRCRSDGLMGFLGTPSLGSVQVGLGRHTLRTVLLRDECTGFFLGFAGHTHAVSTHVGNQSNRAFGANVNAFVELLGQGHGFFARKAQLT